MMFCKNLAAREAGQVSDPDLFTWTWRQECVKMSSLKSYLAFP